MYMNKIKNNLPHNWVWNGNNGREYQLIEVDAYSLISMNSIANMISIQAAYRIENPFLYAQFLLKRDEYRMQNYTEVKQLYHCTARKNVHSIASMNLDYRRVKRNRYGQGVSFSPNMNYANTQANLKCGLDRSMLICDVLIGSCQRGYASMSLPTDGFDTTIDKDCNVYVKYYDYEFYPKYVVNYQISHKPR